jgi:hypothetical protein
MIGLIGIIATALNQHFRFDIPRKATLQKLQHLRALKRYIKDEVYKLEQYNPEDANAVAVREEVTKRLNQIEAEETNTLERGSDV